MAQQFLTRAEFLDQTIPADAVASVSSGTIDTALVWASGVASSYLRKRYKLPLISWGEELKAQVGDLAKWKLFGKIGIRPGSGNNEVARLSFEDAVAWFKDLARGLVEIECVDSTPEVDEEGSLSAGDAPISFRMVTGTGRNGGCCDE